MLSAALPEALPMAHPLKMPGRILALDYGHKRLGMAVSDEMQLTVQPHHVYYRVNRREDFRYLRQTVRSLGVRRIVLGRPVHIDGQRSEMTDEVENYAIRLRKELGIEVVLQDERLTTWEARQLQTAKRSGNEFDPVDAIAAAVLLRDYLEHHRASGPTLLPEID
ncbi:MAG: Holliday junction resolvase RuvX [Candidatus Acidiferrales bacterium]